MLCFMISKGIGMKPRLFARIVIGEALSLAIGETMSKSLENILKFAEEAKKKYPMIDINIVRSEYFFGQEQYKEQHKLLPGIAGAITFIEASEDAGALQAARYVNKTIRSFGTTFRKVYDV